MTDPVDDLLRPPPPDAADPLRQALLLQTTRLLRRRRRAKHLAFAGVMAACYAAGMLTMRFWMPPLKPDKGMASRRQEKVPRQRSVSPKKDREHNPPLSADESALSLEWRAVDNSKNRFELYRRAGDLYLQGNDVQSALRCYRGALAAAPARTRIISVSDNWLFMIAKQERQKEQTDAKNGG